MSTTAIPASSAAPSEATPARRWPPVIWALMFGIFIVRAAGFCYPFLSYHLTGIGLDAHLVGRILAVFGAGWLVGQVICGYLADRIGRRTTLVAAMLLAAAALPVLATVQSPVTVLVCVFLTGLVYDAPRPIVGALIDDTISDDEQRAKINGARHFVINVAAALTGFLGGILAAPVGMPALFLANAVACLTFAVIALWSLPPEWTWTRARAPREERNPAPHAAAY